MNKLNEFNQRLMLAFNGYSNVKHLSSGSNGRHPTLRKVLLDDVKSDLKTLGLEPTIDKWCAFCGMPRSESHENGSKKQKLYPTTRKGRRKG